MTLIRFAKLLPYPPRLSLKVFKKDTLDLDLDAKVSIFKGSGVQSPALNGLKSYIAQSFAALPPTPIIPGGSRVKEFGGMV